MTEAVINEEEQAEAPTLISEIENFLKSITHRTLVDTSEVQDFLLDLRNIADSQLN